MAALEPRYRVLRCNARSRGRGNLGVAELGSLALLVGDVRADRLYQRPRPSVPHKPQQYCVDVPAFPTFSTTQTAAVLCCTRIPDFQYHTYRSSTVRCPTFRTTHTVAVLRGCTTRCTRPGA
eukprot:1342721-Rhodomonas_salina.2